MKPKPTGMKKIVMCAIGAYALTRFMCPYFEIFPNFDYDKKTKVYQTKQAQDTVDKPLCGITTEYDRG